MRKLQKQKYQHMQQYIFLKGKQHKIIENLTQQPNIDFIDFVDSFNNTPLHYACSINYNKAIDKYMQMLNNKQLWQQKYGNGITSQFIKYKIKIWVNAQNNDGLTALHYAAIKGYVDIAQRLQNSGARVDKTTNKGLTVFSLAAQQGKIQSILFFSGKININMRDHMGCTALHWAVSKSQIAIVRYLVRQKQIQLDFQQKQGRTPLHVAVQFSHIKIVQILLMAGADRKIKDKQNKTPLYYALQLKNQKIINMLTAQQKSGCKKQYVYKPQKKPTATIMIISFTLIFLLTAINSLFKLVPGVTEEINLWNTLLNPYNYYYIASVGLLTIMTCLIAFHIRCKEVNKQMTNVSYLLTNPQISHQYCFQCAVIAESGIQHCYICNSCVQIKMKHSNFLGVCIGKHNIKRYLLFLIILALTFCSQILIGCYLLLLVIETHSNNIELLTKVLNYVMICLNLICIAPLILVVIFMYHTAKVLCNMRRFQIIKNISQSTFDSRSTLIAQKLNNLSVHQKRIKQKQLE